MNLVIPIASNSKFFSIEDYGYPKPLIEIAGKSMIEHVICNLTQDIGFKKIIFIVKQDDCDRYHLDNTLTLLSPIKSEIIKLRSDTQGALCSILLAIDHIGIVEPLVISNADQLFDGGISGPIGQFLTSTLDAGCLTFNSVHPRWSYVRLDSQNLVVEAAEKRPISRHAIAGLYMYKSGLDFVMHGMDSIKHSTNTDDQFYISPVFNSYVLANKKVGHFEVLNDRYHTLYSPKKVSEYEAFLARGLK